MMMSFLDIEIFNLILRTGKLELFKIKKKLEHFHQLSVLESVRSESNFNKII